MKRLDASGVQYLVRYGEDSDLTAFRKAVHEQYYMRSYVASGENNRIIDGGPAGGDVYRHVLCAAVHPSAGRGGH